jgi:hypothetical protein
MKLASRMVLLCAVVLLLSLQLDASPQPSPPSKDALPEVTVVLRISRKLINELTTEKVQRTTPVHLHLLEAEMRGQALTNATGSVQFEPMANETGFVIELQGTTVSQTVIDRPPVQVFGSGRMTFIVRKRVAFEGVRFRTQPTTLEASFCSSVDGLATPPGLIGVFVRLIATPIVQRQAPLFAAAAFEEGKAQLVATFDEEVQQIIDDLNQVSPLEETVQKLFPETKDWIYYASSTPTHLIIGVGPPQHRVPELPVSEKTNAPIEVWIRARPQTQAMIQVLKLWRDANKQLRQMLPPSIGKALTFEGEIKTQTVKDWFVIQLGAQSRKRTLEQEAAWAWRSESPGDGTRPLFAQDRCEPAGAMAETIEWRPARQTVLSGDAGQELSPAVHADEATRITIVWRPASVPWSATPPSAGPLLKARSGD